MKDTDVELELQNLRAQVDDIDAKIVALLKARLQLALHMGHIKSKSGSPLRNQERELSVLSRLAEINEASSPKLPRDELKNVYQQIMAWSLAAQKEQEGD